MSRLIPGKLYRLADVNWHRMCHPSVEANVFLPGVYMLVDAQRTESYANTNVLWRLNFLVGKNIRVVNIWNDEIEMWLKAVD